MSVKCGPERMLWGADAVAFLWAPKIPNAPGGMRLERLTPDRSQPKPGYEQAQPLVTILVTKVGNHSKRGYRRGYQPAGYRLSRGNLRGNLASGNLPSSSSVEQWCPMRDGYVSSSIGSKGE